MAADDGNIEARGSSYGYAREGNDSDRFKPPMYGMRDVFWQGYQRLLSVAEHVEDYVAWPLGPQHHTAALLANGSIPPILSATASRGANTD